MSRPLSAWVAHELGLDGASTEEIDAYLDERVTEEVELADDIEEAGDEVTFRASGSWSTHTIGSRRLRVRNGVTTPVIGSRRAWTEAQTQRRNWAGAWNKVTATEICVNAGRNIQEHFIQKHSLQKHC